MQHVIRKQLFEISSASRDELFVLQHEASKYYYREVLPVLEKIFNELSVEGEVLQLDKLEIDLGLLEWDKSKREMSCDAIEQLLREKIKEQLSVKAPPINGKQHLPGIKTTSLAHNACEQWLHYMEHGVLPWNITAIDEDWKMQVLEILATDFKMVGQLRQLVGRKESIARRIALSHDAAFLVKLVEILTAHDQKQLPAIIDQLLTFYRQTVVPVTTAPAVWLKLVRQAAAATNQPGPDLLVQQLLEADLRDGHINREQVKDKKQYPPLLVSLLGKMSIRIETIPEYKPGDKHIEKIKDQQRVKTVTDRSEATTEPFAPTVFHLPPEGLFVEHAGLLLLHPFLRSLFRNSGLLTDGRFTNRLAQEKAILLLNYAVTGSDTYEEHLLAVPKILCAWPIEEPLSTDTLLEAGETTEANDMLNAAIAQWSILKSTTPGGLREGFLQRRGKTYLHNGGIYFQVEKSAIDMLLDHLPWNISIVKLPWLNELIRVEWR